MADTPPLRSSSYNASSDGTCNFSSPSLNNANLPLGPLNDYGGPTLTHLPDTGSDAIDLWTGCEPNLDQRGRITPVGDACDVGAVETGAPADLTGVQWGDTNCRDGINAAGPPPRPPDRHRHLRVHRP